MGFGSIAASIIMFIAVLTLSTSVFVSMKADMANQQDAMREQSQFLSNSMKTSISIENLGYDNETNETSVSVRNIGKTKLDIDLVDVYIDLDFIPRNTTNRTLTLDSSTDNKNIGIWDSNEVINIIIPKDLATGEHILKITVQYGVYEEDIYSVSYT